MATIDTARTDKNGALYPPKSADQLGEWAKRHLANPKSDFGPKVDSIDAYVTEYRKGWRASSSSSEETPWHTGMSSWAFDDGYLDGAAGRPMWHYTYCDDPDTCGEH